MKHYTAKELAQRWGVTKESISRYRREGLLHSAGQRGAGVTAAHEYDEAEVTRFENQHRVIVRPQ